jgi:hypothetical protein
MPATAEITLLDMCDRCGVHAKVVATLTRGTIFLCGHHARAAGTNLVLQAIRVYDPEGVFNYGKQG